MQTSLTVHCLCKPLGNCISHWGRKLADQAGRPCCWAEQLHSSVLTLSPACERHAIECASMSCL